MTPFYRTRFKNSAAGLLDDHRSHYQQTRLYSGPWFCSVRNTTFALLTSELMLLLLFFALRGPFINLACQCGISLTDLPHFPHIQYHTKLVANSQKAYSVSDDHTQTVGQRFSGGIRDTNDFEKTAYAPFASGPSSRPLPWSSTCFPGPGVCSRSLP